jgi:hypothetical protein
MTAPRFTAFDDGTPRPAWWEKGVLAAYYRLLGSSQKAASAAVGRNERTIRNWEANTTVWTRATQAAKDRWLGEVISLARRQLLKAMTDADGDLSLKILERVDEALAPASQRVKHEGGVQLTQQPEWTQMRAAILTALAPFPEARILLAGVLTQESLQGETHRNGTNGTGH